MEAITYCQFCHSPIYYPVRDFCDEECSQKYYEDLRELQELGYLDMAAQD